MSVPEIALVYAADCPNASAAREALREALERCGLDSRWDEYERRASRAMGPYAQYGSPTILVDGTDVGGESAAATAASCRVYPTAGGFRGVPPVDAIVAAVRAKLPDRRDG